MLPPDPGFSASHPPAPTKEWDQFEVDTGTANVSKRLEEAGFGGRTARRIFVRGDDANLADVKIGPDQNADVFPVGSGEVFQIPTDGQPTTIGEWWIKSTSANQKVRVTYE